jgi:hypothetical protein
MPAADLPGRQQKDNRRRQQAPTRQALARLVQATVIAAFGVGLQLQQVDQLNGARVHQPCSA